MLSIKELINNNLFSFLLFGFTLYYLLSFIDFTINRGFMLLILILLITLYIYNKKVSLEESAKESKYNILSNNIDPHYKYVYSNYLIAYIFYLLVPYKLYNPLAYNNAVKKTNKLLKFNEISKKNQFYINTNNLLTMIEQLKGEILNDLTSIIINMPIGVPLLPNSQAEQLFIQNVLNETAKEENNVSGYLYAAEPVLKKLVYYLNNIFENIMTGIKKQINNQIERGI